MKPLLLAFSISLILLSAYLWFKFWTWKVDPDLDTRTPDKTDWLILSLILGVPPILGFALLKFALRM